MEEVKSKERAASDGGAIIIMGFMVYMIFISYIMYSVYGDSLPLFSLSNFDMPGWLTVVTGAWLVWVFEVVANFFILMGFTIAGHGIPEWLNLFFVLPFLFGVGFTILALLRG